MTVNHDALIAAATNARKKAYAPYSGFKIGAALLDGNGRVYTNQNVENAAYPSGIYAKTAAIAMMVQKGETKIVKIVVSSGDGGQPWTPRDSCQQRVQEFATDMTHVLFCDPPACRPT